MRIYEDKIRIAAVRLSDEIGPLLASRALGIRVGTVLTWRNARPDGERFAGRKAARPWCAWCGKPLKQGGLCVATTCREEYIADALEEATKV